MKYFLPTLFFGLCIVFVFRLRDPGPPAVPHFNTLYSGNYECFVVDGKHFYADKFTIFAIDPGNGGPPMAFSTWVCG